MYNNNAMRKSKNKDLYCAVCGKELQNGFAVICQECASLDQDEIYDVPKAHVKVVDKNKILNKQAKREQGTGADGLVGQIFGKLFDFDQVQNQVFDQDITNVQEIDFVEDDD